MNLRHAALLAAALIAQSAAHAAPGKDSSCGAGSCGKKTATAPKNAASDAACSKKDGGCSKKDGGKESSCSKKDGGCSKK
ncbi:hypothetical protein [Ideonella alba]|uniref:Periplasmic protein n=1 Tax=Ideonella alba TaxID=2824118 RepID=A0A941BF33_9BURK|nr:hypothetical protein [Ideonella alba]MBQ0928983.1 hypothetical protein [Ideonella alba]